MALESGTRIEDLVQTNPDKLVDDVSEGANHFQLIKRCIQGSLPNLGAEAVTKTALDINNLLRADGSEPMTGNLVVHKGSPTITLKGVGSNYPKFELQDTAGVTRLSLQYNDDGTDTCAVTRRSAAGAIECTLGLAADGNAYVVAVAPTEIYHLTRKDYVDTMLPLAGGTMTGDLLVNHGASPSITVEPASSGNKGSYLINDSAGRTRGELLAFDSDGTVDLKRYDTSAVEVNRLRLDASGNVTIGFTTDSQATAVNNLTRKDYVDGEITTAIATRRTYSGRVNSAGSNVTSGDSAVIYGQWLKVVQVFIRLHIV